MKKLLQRLLRAIANWIRRCLPAYNPTAWNDANGIQHHNNCYNYACNHATGTFAQPGRGTGAMYASLSCDDVSAGAASDGLAPIDCDTGCGCKDCCHQVALVVAPDWDFHWYRKDRDGKWSHKPGSTQATNLDQSGNIITDPRTADRGRYTHFCGCFCVCKGKFTIN